jgi:phosphorylcholine metabolism protein LicD
MDWHQTLRGGYIVIDQQKLRKALNSKSKVLKNSPYPLSFESIPVKDYSHLLRVGKQETLDEYYIRAEYSRAYDYVYRFSKTVDDLAITDSTIRKLNIEEVDIMKKIVTNAESDRMDLLYRFCCPFCGKYELIEKGKKPKSCESSECTKAYSASTTRKSSNQPHALIKKLKKTDSQWVKVDNIPRVCADTCGKRRLVDAKQICKKCFYKPRP